MDRVDNKSASFTWDAKQAEASQAARDAEIEELLSRMTTGVALLCALHVKVTI